MQEMVWSVEFLDEKVREALDDFPLIFEPAFNALWN